MAANEEVSTTRCTPAARAARSTRSVPSRAGMMSSSSCLGAASGKGEATCSTYWQPAMDSRQPASFSSSAAKKRTLSASLAPAFAQHGAHLALAAAVAHGGVHVVPGGEQLHDGVRADESRATRDQYRTHALTSSPAAQRRVSQRGHATQAVTSARAILR